MDGAQVARVWVAKVREDHERLILRVKLQREQALDRAAGLDLVARTLPDPADED